MDQVTKDRFDEIDEILARTNDTLRELAEQLGKVAIQQTEFALSWSVENQMLKDRTEETRARLQEKIDVLERFVGQGIDKIVDHAADPEAHPPSE